MTRTWLQQFFSGSMRRVLLWIVVVVVAPLLAMEVGICWLWFQSRAQHELQDSLEIARAVGAIFENFVIDVQRDEGATGAALLGLKPYTTAQANQFLAGNARLYPAIHRWHWITPQGRVLASSDLKEESGTFEIGDDSVQRTLAERGWATSDRRSSAGKDGATTFLIITRLAATTEDLESLIVGEVETEKLSELTSPIARVAGGAFALFDRQGTVAFIQPAAPTIDPQWRKKDELLDIVLREREEHTGRCFLPIGGGERFGARVPLKSTGWVAGASRTVSASMAGVYQALWAVIGANLLVLGLSVLAAAAVSRKIMRPVHRLQAHAEAIGRGELSHQTEQTGIAELSALATAFNRMGDQLAEAQRQQQQAYGLLEQRVQERTAELRASNEALRDEMAAHQKAQAEVLRLAAIVESSVDAILSKGLDGTILTWNHGAEQLFGYAAHEVIGRPVAVLAPPDRSGEYLELLSRIQRGEMVKQFETVRVAKDGRTIDVSVTISPMLDASGRLIGASTMTRDITQRKKAERRDHLTKTLLELFARESSRKEYLASVVAVMREWSGCRCLGIRVVDPQESIPYEAYVGFSREFWETENRLSLRDDACICTRVIRAAPAPHEAAQLTPSGSFHCGDVAEFVAALPADQQAAYRGHCVRVGFRSLAVIPIRYRDEVLGALHLADERPDMVPPVTIEFLESMTPLLGEAIHRFNMEDELRSASLYARELLEASLDPLVTISPAGQVTDVNAATEAVTGVGRDQLIGSDFSRYFTEPERASEGYRQVMAEGLVRDYPLTIRHVSGRTTDVLYNAVVYRNGAGQIEGVFAAARDVTERKKAEAAVLAERQRFFDVLETLPPMICLLTPDYHVSFANRSFREKFGESHGRFCYESCFGRDKPCEFCESYKVLETGQPHHWEVTGPDGSVIAAYDFPFTDVDGLPLILEMDMDITEQRKAEAELTRHREHLEELVRQRTAELESANRQLQVEIAERQHAADVLRTTADDLSRSNKELEQFAYVASHDLQEPLRVITGYLQLIDRRYKGKIDADVDQFIYYTVDGAARMQQLISDLLQYSRVGTRGEQFGPTNMNRVLQKTLAGLQKAIEESGATITSDELPTVEGDEVQLGQLLLNLIGNGIKFCGECRPQIHVSARQEDGRWQFSVRDNGIGIEPQYWEQIFVIFRRLHTRQKYSGTGIGLAICKKIVERHGGKIWLESKPGEGTNFFFTLSAA